MPGSSVGTICFSGPSSSPSRSLCLPLRLRSSFSTGMSSRLNPFPFHFSKFSWALSESTPDMKARTWISENARDSTFTKSLLWEGSAFEDSTTRQNIWKMRVGVARSGHVDEVEQLTEVEPELGPVHDDEQAHGLVLLEGLNGVALAAVPGVGDHALDAVLREV